MSIPPPEDLRARVAALEAENAALRSTPAAAGAPPRRSRAVLAVVLILLGVLLAPVAVVTGWATWTLTDTDRFVATYAPLSGSPEVRAYVVDQAMAAVDAEVDLDGLTQELVDGLVALGTGPRATVALRTFQATAADGLRSLIRDGVTEFVASDQFDAAWAETLRIGHSQLIATLSNDPAAVATIGEDGSLGIPLGPIVERVKTDLVERGITVAGSDSAGRPDHRAGPVRPAADGAASRTGSPSPSAPGCPGWCWPCWSAACWSRTGGRGPCCGRPVASRS